MKNTIIKYGFIHKKTRLPVLVHSSPSGEHTSFTNDNFGDVFELDTVEKLINCCVSDPKWYNCSDDRPAWGGFNPNEDFLAVKITKTIKIEELELKRPAIYNQIDHVRDIAFLSAKNYCPDIAKAKRYVFVLLKSIGNEKLPQVGDMAFFGDIYNKRKILGIVKQMPEEWLDKVGQDGALLICSESFY